MHTPHTHTHTTTHTHTQTIQVPGEKDFGDGEMEEVLTGPVTLLDGVPMPVLNLSCKEEEGAG